MTNRDLCALTAAVILAGRYAEGDSSSRDYMVLDAITTTDTLLKALFDIEPLKKRIAGCRESRRKPAAPPKAQKTPVYAPQDFIDRLPESDRAMYTPLREVTP